MNCPLTRGFQLKLLPSQSYCYQVIKLEKFSVKSKLWQVFEARAAGNYVTDSHLVLQSVTNLGEKYQLFLILLITQVGNNQQRVRAIKRIKKFRHMHHNDGKTLSKVTVLVFIAKCDIHFTILWFDQMVAIILQCSNIFFKGIFIQIYLGPLSINHKLSR